MKEDIKEKSSKQVVEASNPVLWPKNVSNKRKRLLYNAIIHSIMLYSSEVQLNTKTSEKGPFGNRNELLATIFLNLLGEPDQKQNSKREYKSNQKILSSPCVYLWTNSKLKIVLN